MEKEIGFQRCRGVVVALALLVAWWGQVAGAVTFTLDNQSDVIIQRVYAGPDYEQRWDEDLLGSTVLPPGNQRQFHVAAEAGHCVFDIRVLWSNGLWRSFMGRDLCEDADVVFDGGLGFIVSNESETTIGVVQASSGSEESWGPDRLRENELIAPGAERVFMLEQRYSGSCIFDIALRTMESNVEYRGRDLCDDPKVVFHEGNKLTVLNEGPLAVHFVRLSPDHDSQGWGQDLLGDKFLHSGQELAVRLHQYSEDQCLFDVLIVDADEQQHLYEQVDVCKTEPLAHPQARQPVTVRTAQVAGAVTFTLDNQSDVIIQRVYAGPDYEQRLEEDLLGSTVLPSGNQRQFHVEGEAGHCVFDIHVFWSNGFWRSFMGRDLCENADVVFDGGLGFIVSNESETTIGMVQASSGSEESWGPDRLREDELIAPGAERIFMLEQRYNGGCIFDIALRTLESEVEYRDRDLCDDPKVVFHDGNTLTVLNEGPLAVHFVRLSPDHDSQGWGPDLLGDEVLPSGEELAVRLHQYSEDQCLFDVLVVDADEQQHLYEQVNVCSTDPLVHPQGSTDDAPRPPVAPRVDLSPGETFRDCDDWPCPWMVVVNGGAFERGSWERDDETPVTEVTVPGPFAVGQFEVSVGQFAEFARATDHDNGTGCYVRRRSMGRNTWDWTNGLNWRNPGFDQDDSHPVVCVNWHDADAYTKWLADRTGRPYRLPTEAEAELIAKASATNFEQSGRANCRDCGSQWDGKGTSPVGRTVPDNLGLTGVFGNAAEWVQDCYQTGYSNAPRDGSAWSPPNCERRVVRGGCWFTKAQKLRPSARDYSESDRRSGCVGFRVVLDGSGNR